MKREPFPIAVIAAAFLLLPAYGGAQQVVPVADKTPAVTTAPAGALAAMPAAAPSAAEAKTAAAGTAADSKADAVDAAAAPPSPPKPVVEAGAAAALKRTSDYLQTLKTFSVRVDSSTDEVLDNGQKLQFNSLADVSVVKPDRLRVDVVADDRQRQFYYDGKTLTLYAKQVNYYASVKAPKTITAMLDFAETKYGLEWPLADLLDPESLAKNVRSGFLVGESRVRGVLCDHFAFRQDDVDWQIWIQQGKAPLPRKIVITSKDVEGAPQHVSVLSWNLSPRLTDSAFRFVAPKSASKIVFRELETQPGNEK